MKKSELLKWLQEEYQKWQEFLDQIDPIHMDQPQASFKSKENQQMTTHPLKENGIHW